MSNAVLRTRVKRLASALSQEGFALRGSYVICRRAGVLVQHIELRPLTGAQAGRFTCSLGWAFDWDRYPEVKHFDFDIDLELLEGGYPASIPIQGDLDARFVILERRLRARALPFLDQCLDLRDMTEDADTCFRGEAEGTVSPRVETKWPMLPPSPFKGDDPRVALLKAPRFFGISEDWSCYNLGRAFIHLDQVERGADYLRNVIDHHSEPPIPWILRRRKRCEEILTALSAPDH